MKPGIDLSCAKTLKIRGPKIGICEEGYELGTGLCYKFCEKGYSGAGPVCWMQTPTVYGEKWANCGMAAAATKKDCGMAIGDMVANTVMAVINIATLGAGNVATLPAKATMESVQTVADIGISCGMSIADGATEEDAGDGAKTAVKGCLTSLLGSAIDSDVGSAALRPSRGEQTSSDAVAAPDNRRDRM